MGRMPIRAQRDVIDSPLSLQHSAYPPAYAWFGWARQAVSRLVSSSRANESRYETLTRFNTDSPGFRMVWYTWTMNPCIVLSRFSTRVFKNFESIQNWTFFANILNRPLRRFKFTERMGRIHGRDVLLPLPCARTRKEYIYTESQKIALRHRSHLALRRFTPKRYSPVAIRDWK